jgi:hypothetical protein
MPRFVIASCHGSARTHGIVVTKVLEPTQPVCCVQGYIQFGGRDPANQSHVDLVVTAVEV